MTTDLAEEVTVTLTLELTPEMTEKLQAEVIRRGVPAEQIVDAALKCELVRSERREFTLDDRERKLSEIDKEDWDMTGEEEMISDNAITRETLVTKVIESNAVLADFDAPFDEEEAAFQAFLDECEKTKTPFIPDEFLRREYIYEDRGAEPCSETRI